MPLKNRVRRMNGVTDSIERIANIKWNWAVYLAVITEGHRKVTEWGPRQAILNIATPTGWVHLETDEDNNVPIILKRRTFNKRPPCAHLRCRNSIPDKTSACKRQRTQRKMERLRLGISMRDRRSNTLIRKKTGLDDVLGRITRTKWR